MDWTRSIHLTILLEVKVGEGWFMVKGVAHKYETVKGVIFYSGGKASTWWKDLQSIREGVGLGFLTGLIII